MEGTNHRNTNMKYIFKFSPKYFTKSCCYILLIVDAFLRIEADLESEVAKAARKLRNNFIVAETMIGRELCFWVFKEKRLITKK